MHEVPGYVTWVFAGLLALMVLALALEEKLHARKSVLTGTAAALSLLLGAAFGILPLESYRVVLGEGHVKELPAYVPGIEWEVIAIILGASLFVEITSKSGLFSYIAIRLTRVSQGDPRRLLFLYGAMTVGFSALLNNVAAMLIVGALTRVSLERLGKQRFLLGFLLIEGLLTNVGGLLTLISSVPNIIVGRAAGIGFLGFFVKAAPLVLVASAVTLWMGARRYKIHALDGDEARREARAQVEGFSAEDAVSSRGFFLFSGVMLVLFVLSLSLAGALPVIRDLGMGFVALSFGLMMLWKFKATAERKYAALDWDLLAFFATLFVVVDVMEHAGVLALIGQGIAALVEAGPRLGTGLLLGSAALASSVTDNIPLAAVLSNILSAAQTSPESPLWWSVIFGANLGGNLTPIGSASTVVAVTLMHKSELKVSFFGFVREAAPFALAQLALAAAYVLLFL